MLDVLDHEDLHRPFRVAQRESELRFQRRLDRWQQRSRSVSAGDLSMMSKPPVRPVRSMTVRLSCGLSASIRTQSDIVMFW